MRNDIIDEAFEQLIKQRGIHKELGETSDSIRSLRYKLAKGKAISIDLKLRLLQNHGWSLDAQKYSRKDLVSLLNFYRRTGQSAKDLGDDYVIQKWETISMRK